MIELKIDPEFRDKIPPMPKEDFEGLKEDILRDGYVRDPLVVWKEENMLLDGHNRWRIIQENHELLCDKFTVDYKSFPDRWACIAWICANQLHKHNMNEMQRAKLLQEEYEARKNTSSFKGNQYVTSGGEENLHKQNGKTPKLRVEMMKEHNISAYEMQTAVEVGRGIDRAEKAIPGIKQEILSGELKASKKEIAEIRKLQSDEEVKAAVEEIRNPKPKKEKNPNIQPVGERKRFPKMTEEDRERMEFIHKINETQQDIDREIEYTVDDLVNEITVNGMNYVSSLRATLINRKELFVGYAIDQVTEAVNQLISEIEKAKELIV